MIFKAKILVFGFFGGVKSPRSGDFFFSGFKPLSKFRRQIFGETDIFRHAGRKFCSKKNNYRQSWRKYNVFQAVFVTQGQ